MSLSYTITEKTWNGKDLEPKSTEECRGRNDWPKQKDEIQAELSLFAKYVAFGPTWRYKTSKVQMGICANKKGENKV